MSTCTFCGNPAGFFHHTHRECSERHERGKREITNLILEASSSAATTPLADRIKQISDQSFISDAEKYTLSISAWLSAVDHALQNHVISEDAEKQLMNLSDKLSITSSDVQRSGAWDRIVKSAVIRDLLNGAISIRMTFAANLPFNLQKGEEIVWLFDKSDYLEDITRRQYVGGSRGVSVKIMKGVYYHVGAFKGQTVERTQRTHVDTGMVAVTNQNLYFDGTTKSFRIPYSKIVSFEPFSDAIGVMRDTKTAKHQFFVTRDGWFTYNLVTNLARL